MADPQETDHRVDVLRYFALVEEGLIAPDDRVELLDGVIVSMAPQSPLHAAGVMWVEQKLRESLPAGTAIRIQMPFMAGAISVPEPDVAVVRGGVSDYVDRHPSSALLVVEVAVSSAVQDRLTKAPIYAAAGIPNYWLIDLRDECIEVFSGPVAAKRRYWRTEKLRGNDALTLEAFPEVRFVAADLFPRRST
ncbi:MAG: Uma2 family endonuclease [Deltaproteobacteria bacterium]|nr:Uma2 family endonuclease [Deltaproteobacteria bacterium]